jgi:hypothetical protein
MAAPESENEIRHCFPFDCLSAGRSFNKEGMPKGQVVSFRDASNQVIRSACALFCHCQSRQTILC